VAEWTETYRGVVNAWECDIVEHFTIAYYFDRFADATRNFLDLIGEGEALGAAVNVGPSRLYVTFQHELRAGAQFNIISAVMGVDDKAVRLGHQVVDSTNGKTVTWVAETIALPAGTAAGTRKKLEGLVVAWTGPKIADATSPKPGQGIPTYRDRVKPWEIGESGTLSLPGHVHRFSAAAMQSLAAIGMTAAYMKDQRRGFSTFEIDLNLVAPSKVGTLADVTTVVSHLGSSSIRILHTMTCKKAGHVLASMGQSGVHLDMEARRSTPMPPELRELASKLLVAKS
jgi:acyl-CoA thioesterase FadM